jgi:hypothetical protein
MTNKRVLVDSYTKALEEWRGMIKSIVPRESYPVEQTIPLVRFRDNLIRIQDAIYYPRARKTR